MGYHHYVGMVTKVGTQVVRGEDHPGYEVMDNWCVNVVCYWEGLAGSYDRKAVTYILCL